MPFQQFAPQSSLKPFIKGYFTLQMNEILSQARKEKILPNGLPLWVLHYGKGGQGLDHQENITSLPRQYFLGQTTAEHYFKHTGDIDVLGVIFKPAALSHLFKVPMNELTDNLINPELIIGREASHIFDQTQGIAQPQAKVICLEDFLIKRLMKSNQTFEHVDEIINFLESTPDLPKVKELNDLFGFHRDSLRQRFHQKIGIGPKMYLRIIRFLNIIKDGIKNPHFDLQDLSFRAGFYDQAHFTKEFKKFAGTTPRRFFKQEKQKVKPLGLIFS